MRTPNRFNRPLIVGLSALAFVAAGCLSSTAPLNRIGSPPYERGSGTSATETRPIVAFHAIEASQGVQVVVESGSNPAVIVTADDNLVSHIATTVVDGTLRIGVTGSIETRLPPKIRVISSGLLDSIIASSAVTVDVRHIEATALIVRATSASTVMVAGKVDRLDLHVEFASTAELSELEVTDAAVSVGSASRATARIANSVSGSCLTASTLELRGRPRSQSVTTDGTSSVRVR